MNFLELMRDDSIIDFGRDQVANLKNRSMLLGAAKMLIPVATALDIQLGTLVELIDADEVLNVLKLNRKAVTDAIDHNMDDNIAVWQELGDM